MRKNINNNFCLYDYIMISVVRNICYKNGIKEKRDNTRGSTLIFIEYFKTINIVMVSFITNMTYENSL